jgi:N-acetylglucosamine kinase-like BadF-type ATPase
MGPLHAVFRDALGLAADLDLCAQIMNAYDRGSIAAMSQLVARAAREGDASAVQIFDDAARELAAVAEAVRQTLQFEPNEPVPISYSGGVFNAGDLVLGPFQRHLETQSRSFQLRAPMFTPSVGAAIHAANFAAQPLSAAAMQRLWETSVAIAAGPRQ